MYGLWVGRLTPDEARQKARDWRFSEDRIEEMITEATKPPSYWAQHAAGQLPPPTATALRRRDPKPPR